MGSITFAAISAQGGCDKAHTFVPVGTGYGRLNLLRPVDSGYGRLIWKSNPGRGTYVGPQAATARWMY